jgi:hypothetical protein
MQGVRPIGLLQRGSRDPCKSQPPRQPLNKIMTTFVILKTMSSP